MRRVGRISEWNDDRGYGFVVPHDGGERAFVHMSAFQPGSRRPASGDLISYETGRDERGRVNARTVRFAGKKAAAPRPVRAVRGGGGWPRARAGVAALVAVAAAVLAGWLPVAVGLAYGVLSAVSYLMYWFDKGAAQDGRRRTPESSLHLVDLLGGWPGALIAQQRFRHKTVKAPFQAAFWVTVVANVAAVAWLVANGHARTLESALGG